MNSLLVVHVPLDPFPGHRRQRNSSQDDRISEDKWYFAKIYGVWNFGQFSKLWYGWSFNDWGVSGIQLNTIQDLYEVDISQLDAS